MFNFMSLLIGIFFGMFHLSADPKMHLESFGGRSWQLTCVEKSEQSALYQYICEVEGAEQVRRVVSVQQFFGFGGKPEALQREFDRMMVKSHQEKYTSHVLNDDPLDLIWEWWVEGDELPRYERYGMYRAFREGRNLNAIQVILLDPDNLISERSVWEGDIRRYQVP